MNPRVALGYVHDNDGGTYSWQTSYNAFRDFDAANSQVLRRELPVRFSLAAGIGSARNGLVREFLACDDVDWLWMVDRDHGFAPDALYRLLSVADVVERPVVGGLCFAAWPYAQDGMGGWRREMRPTIYDWREDADGEGTPGFVPDFDFAVNAVIRCDGTGGAFLLIHRNVLERLGPDCFERLADPTGELLGEDMSFCRRLSAIGIPVHVHTGVRTTHHKRLDLAEFDFWTQRIIPPAVQEVAVIVPVLRRPQNAAPFMRSLRASTGLATVYAVADSDDPETIAAWREAGAEVLVDDVRTYARKVNLGYAKTCQPWIFPVGDDVEFRPGWLDHAQHVASVHGADVIGTNDLGNPRVTSGEHATHFLIRRSYVDSAGASWDGPGVVCHEGYRHWGPDDEIVSAAKQRGKWQMALGSLVVHNHPLWGRAEDDDTYRLGQSSAEQDLTLLRSRLETFTKPKMDRYALLAELHRRLRPRGYVEVGVQTGASLRLAMRPALGIDPRPSLRCRLPETTAVVACESDEFFAKSSEEQRALGLPEHVDLAFIDGMHLCEYALRDFANIERLANERTLVVFDDVLPRNQAEASRVPLLGDWTGDVWKVYYALREVRPDLRLTLVDTDPTGVLLVQFADERPVFTPDYGISLPDEVPDEVLSRALAVSAEEALAAVAP